MKFSAEIIERYFKGTYSRADYKAARYFFSNAEGSDELEKHIEHHWFEITNEPVAEGNVDHLLERIHNQIQAEPGSGRSLSFVAVFQKVAAILVIPLIFGFLALLYSQSIEKKGTLAKAEIICPEGVRTKFVLPDGTTGFLNSGSTLEYPATFDQERTVTLAGEAYFDVEHDEKRPFTVNTPHLATRVLGTQFNVIAYEDEESEEIILKEGEVEVFTRKGDNLGTLQSDQKLGLNKVTNRYGKSKVEAYQYISWTEGKLVFRNESMQQIANRLGRWYNVDISIEDTELLTYGLWATFIDEPIEEVLKLLTLTAPIRYEELERDTCMDGSFKKRKITISLDMDRLNAF
jgi:transmembrane sensor